jgi:hypothetical protein
VKRKEAGGRLRGETQRWKSKRGEAELEIAPGGEAVVDAGTGGANAEDSVAFRKPIRKFGADAGVDFDDAIGIAGLPVLKLGGEMDMGGTFARFGS